MPPAMTNSSLFRARTARRTRRVAASKAKSKANGARPGGISDRRAAPNGLRDQAASSSPYLFRVRTLRNRRWAGLLASGSTDRLLLPAGSFRPQWHVQPSSPVTAAGPQRICTVFPILRPRPRRGQHPCRPVLYRPACPRSTIAAAGGARVLWCRRPACRLASGRQTSAPQPAAAACVDFSELTAAGPAGSSPAGAHADNESGAVHLRGQSIIRKARPCDSSRR